MLLLFFFPTGRKIFDGAKQTMTKSRSSDACSANQRRPTATTKREDERKGKSWMERSRTTTKSRTFVLQINDAQQQQRKEKMKGRENLRWSEVEQGRRAEACSANQRRPTTTTKIEDESGCFNVLSTARRW